MKKAINTMYIKTALLLILTLSINGTAYSSPQSNVDLNPQTRHSFNVEALYSASPAIDPETIIESHASKRMVLQVIDNHLDVGHLPNRWSNKRTSIRAMDTNTGTLSQVIFISGFLETALSSGDEITVDYINPHGTQIRINGVTVINTDSSLLFDHLFNDWLDHSPLNHLPLNHSTTLKTANNDLHSTAGNKSLVPSHSNMFDYDNSQPQLVTSWLSARESVRASQYNQARHPVKTPALEKNTIALVQPKAIPKERVISIDERISALEKRRLAMEVRRLATEERRLEAAEKRLAAAERRLAAEENRLVAEEKKLLSRAMTLTSTRTNNLFTQVDNSNQTAQKQSQQPLAKKKSVKNQKKLKSVVSTTSNPAFIKLENQYYLDLYNWELKTEVYRLVKYPAWAKSLGKKGNVKLNFTVGRDTRVSKVSGDNPNISIQLVSELHRAIMTAAKLVLPPDALPGNSWDMSIAYNFQAKSIQQVAIEKPSKPLFLEREESTVLISSDNNLEKYQEDIKDIISDRIEYPIWAEKLNQKGKVSFEIIINKDGAVTDIIPKEVNRHRSLNREVLKAINESSPLPSIPEHLRLHSTNMIIQHDFQKNRS
jgi:TonB family protein